MLAQIPIALEELRQMFKAGAKNKACILCVEALPIIESMIETISGTSGSLASQLAESAKPQPIEQAFICVGCGTEITINNDDPQKRQFIWTEQKTGKKNAYCIDCDDKLIQGVDLPNAKKKMEVQS